MPEEKEKWVVKRCPDDPEGCYRVPIAEFNTEPEAQEYVDTHDPDFFGDHFEIEKE